MGSVSFLSACFTTRITECVTSLGSACFFPSQRSYMFQLLSLQLCVMGHYPGTRRDNELHFCAVTDMQIFTSQLGYIESCVPTPKIKIKATDPYCVVTIISASCLGETGSNPGRKQLLFLSSPR